MLLKDNKVYLNLEEQVRKNKDDIENISSINGLLGIKVVNQVYGDWELPAEDSEEFAALEYGDAYVVEEGGDEYSFYIKTRPTTEKDYDHWFRLHLEGVQGPVGAEGPKGDKGDKGITGLIALDITDAAISTLDPSDYEVDQSVMTISGNVYRNTGTSWKYITNLRGWQGIQGPQGIQGIQGPQGPQGIQGPAGDPGGFIDIRGRVSAVSQLPTPPEHGYDAYFVGTATPAASNPLYVWTDDGWISIGVLNVATYVTVNGQFVGQWDADTKRNRITKANRVYTTTSTGADATDGVTMSYEPVTGNIPRWDTGAVLKSGSVANIESASGNAVITKDYLAQHAPSGGSKLYKISVTIENGGMRDITITYLSTSDTAPTSTADIPAGNLVLVGTNAFNDGDYMYDGNGFMCRKGGSKYFEIAWIANADGEVHYHSFNSNSIYFSSVEEF